VYQSLHRRVTEEQIKLKWLERGSVVACMQVPNATAVLLSLLAQQQQQERALTDSADCSESCMTKCCHSLQELNLFLLKVEDTPTITIDARADHTDDHTDSGSGNVIGATGGSYKQSHTHRDHFEQAIDRLPHTTESLFSLSPPPGVRDPVDGPVAVEMDSATTAKSKAVMTVKSKAVKATPLPTLLPTWPTVILFMLIVLPVVVGIMVSLAGSTSSSTLMLIIIVALLCGVFGVCMLKGLKNKHDYDENELEDVIEEELRQMKRQQQLALPSAGSMVTMKVGVSNGEAHSHACHAAYAPPELCNDEHSSNWDNDRMK